MVYCGTVNVERIVMHPMNDLSETHYIEMVTSKDEPTFFVTCCCDEEWYYEFVYSKSDYERVKFNIMEMMFSCDTMDELLDALSEIFTDGFEEICIDEEVFEDECDGCEECRGCCME